MDELKVLKARVFVLEQQMEKMNVQLREFIEAFEEYSQSLAMRQFLERSDDEVEEPAPMAE